MTITVTIRSMANKAMSLHNQGQTTSTVRLSDDVFGVGAKEQFIPTRRAVCSQYNQIGPSFGHGIVQARRIFAGIWRDAHVVVSQIFGNLLQLGFVGIFLLIEVTHHLHGPLDGAGAGDRKRLGMHQQDVGPVGTCQIHGYSGGVVGQFTQIGAPE